MSEDLEIDDDWDAVSEDHAALSQAMEQDDKQPTCDQVAHRLVSSTIKGAFFISGWVVIDCSHVILT